MTTRPAIPVLDGRAAETARGTRVLDGRAAETARGSPVLDGSAAERAGRGSPVLDGHAAGTARRATAVLDGQVATDAPLALELRDVRRSFGRVEVLRGATLELAPGVVAGLAGRNGAGKTTLLRIAAGLIVADAGTVRLAGLDPECDRREHQRRLGWLPAGNGGLTARLTVRQNLDLWAGMALLPRRRRHAAVDAALVRFGLADLAARRADRLSMGQRQRVRLATAFLHEPSVVLLDEPATSLDDDALALLVAELRSLAGRGGAALWCAPAPPYQVQLDRCYVLENGVVRPA